MERYGTLAEDVMTGHGPYIWTGRGRISKSSVAQCLPSPECCSVYAGKECGIHTLNTAILTQGYISISGGP
jgi:hypothetical protein